MRTIKENVALSPQVSFRIGGRAKYFSSVSNKNEILETLNFAQKKKLPVFVLGSGTNILVSDKGFDGVVIQIRNSKLEIRNSIIDVDAGMLVSDLLDKTLDHNLSGLEWAGGLPGTLGGAIRGNAGCFGGETKNNIEEVTAINMNSLETKRFSNEQCKFDYRSSIFKKTPHWIITGAKLKLSSSHDTGAIRERAQEKIAYRQNRHPLEYPNIGSIFKNCPLAVVPNSVQKKFKTFIKNDPFPILPTAILIADAGLTGKKVGGALVSDKHANFIVNAGKASARDVQILIKQIKKTIKEKFNIDLEEEIQYIGF